MEKILYVFGAGFSAPLGLPVMSDFIEKSKDMYFADAEGFESFKEIFQYFSKLANVKLYYDADLLNIEEVLSIIETLRITGSPDITSEKFQDYITKVIKYYSPKFEKLTERNRAWYEILFCQNRSDRFFKMKNLYGKFVAKLNNIYFTSQDDPVVYNLQFMRDSNYQYSAITMNYDKIIEDIVGQINQDNRIGINSDPKATNLWEKTRISYAKLHGCIDKSIIPPNWNKSITDIQDAWILAYKLLKEANYIRFIGYSLPITDSYVKYLFKAALTENPETTHLKKIDVICYDPTNAVSKRYHEFIQFNNFRFINAKFDEILGDINKSINERHQGEIREYSWHEFELFYDKTISKLKEKQATA